MGTTVYGRSLDVKDKNCMYYASEFAGLCKPSQCTKEDDLLSLCEIKHLICDNGPKPRLIYGGAKAKEIIRGE
jgi:hypothetical protein